MAAIQEAGTSNTEVPALVAGGTFDTAPCSSHCLSFIGKHAANVIEKKGFLFGIDGFF